MLRATHPSLDGRRKIVVRGEKFEDALRNVN